MKKIAFVVIDFGEKVQGGENVHGRMLVEHLAQFYDIEILTSTSTGIKGEEYPEGVSEDNGITVRRFRNCPVNAQYRHQYARKAKNMRRLRYFLGRFGVLKFMTSSHPEWTAGQKADVKYFESQYSHKPGLLAYLAEHAAEYDALLFINMYNSSTVLGSMIAPDKSILIPLAHPTRTLYMPLFTSLFTRVRHIAFNTEAEYRIFGKHMAPGSIVGVGVELPPPANWETVKEKYGLPENYVLYLGRITKDKINSLIPEFLKYRGKYGSAAKLVLAGGKDSRINYSDDPSVIFTGFVTGEEKTAIIEHAALMINPSEKESLSLLMLESMSSGIPVLVNGKSEVMRDHCKASGAALYYDSPGDFQRKLHLLLSDNPLREAMGARGVEYVRTKYDWATITAKLRGLIDGI